LANNLFGSCRDDDGAAMARLSAGEIPNVRAIAACLPAAGRRRAPQQRLPGGVER